MWLLADLSEIGEGCLPDCVTVKKEEFCLDKKYPVQLQWLVDICKNILSTKSDFVFGKTFLYVFFK